MAHAFELERGVITDNFKAQLRACHILHSSACIGKMEHLRMIEEFEDAIIDYRLSTNDKVVHHVWLILLCEDVSVSFFD